MSTPMVEVLVTGSRDWTHDDTIRDALTQVLNEIGDRATSVTLLSGGCPTGADRIAEIVWEQFGQPILKFPADWETHGRRAGFLRNQAMVDRRPVVVLGFIKDGSRGATMTVRLAQKAGVPVRVWTV